MRRPIFLALLVVTLLLPIVGLYWIMLTMLTRSNDPTTDELTSRNPAFSAPSIEDGTPNPYRDQIQAALFDPIVPIQDFSLPSTTGADFTLSDQQDKLVLIYFGYLTCPDFCPTTLANLRRVFIELGAKANDVQVVFLTVDPERDSLELMARYVAAFDERFIGLRGELSQIQPIINNFGVTAARREVDSALGYLVDHTTSIFIVDGGGQLIARFSHGTPYLDMVADIETLLAAQGG